MEQTTNIYGSPIAGSSVAEDSRSSTSPNSPNRELGEGSVHNDVAVLLRPFGQALSISCTCATTCSRKSGKKQRCPCKDASKLCNEHCVCGVKKKGKVVKWCKNGKESLGNHTETQPGVQAATRTDGFLTMEQEIDKANEDIQNYLASLSRDVLEKLVLQLSANGNGSVENIKDVLKYIEDDNSTEEPAQGLDQLPWCKCGACREMPTEKERKCCDRKTCVTSYKLFSKICLDRDVLLIAIKSRNECPFRRNRVHHRLL
eukprot:Seg6569.1 transcript_id=Seg6569.1/GoldUCD/mRNA.D3Y31 product="hypothetical protein" protein_id=Seg6569.1/GoldUCD/D3Y31